MKRLLIPMLLLGACSADTSARTAGITTEQAEAAMQIGFNCVLVDNQDSCMASCYSIYNEYAELNCESGVTIGLIYQYFPDIKLPEKINAPKETTGTTEEKPSSTTVLQVQENSPSR